MTLGKGHFSNTKSQVSFLRTIGHLVLVSFENIIFLHVYISDVSVLVLNDIHMT